MRPINQFIAVEKVGAYLLVEKLISVDMSLLFVNLKTFLKYISFPNLTVIMAQEKLQSSLLCL